MRRLLIAFPLAVALAGTAQAQGVTCRDGTVLSGANARALCAAHGGMPPGSAAPTTSTPGTASPPHAAGQRSHRRRSRPGLGEQEQQSLPLPRRPLLRQDQAGRVHDRGSRQGGWGARQRREGMLLTAARRS